MTVERYSNSFSTTLNGAITSGATSLTVTSATGAPSQEQFRLLIDNEILVVSSGGSGTTTWTVLRGQEGTTAASHSNGATVDVVLTAGAMDKLLFQASDAWSYQDILKSGQPPTIAGGTWTVFNSVTAEDITVGAAGIAAVRIRHAGENANSNQFRGIYQSTPGSTWTLIGRFRRHTPPNTYNVFGLLLRESATGKGMIVGTGYEQGTFGQVRFTAPTTYFNAGAWLSTAGSHAPAEWWAKIVLDATNLTYSYSADGSYWIQGKQEAKTVPFTTAPDQYGIGINSNNTGGTFEHVLDCHQLTIA